MKHLLEYGENFSTIGVGKREETRANFERFKNGILLTIRQNKYKAKIVK